MSNRRRICIFVPVAVAAAAVLYWLFRPGATVPQEFVDAGRPARIDPDYSGCTIPPNIAPLNFVVKEPGAECRVKVYSRRREAFVVSSSTGRIVIPARKWKNLLELNRGNELHFDVYVREKPGRWRRFETVTNTIAREEIDSYLVYRRIKPVHNIYTNMGTYQRDLSTYDESPVVLSGPDSHRCVNCHTFVNNDPDTMCLHIRSRKDGVAMVLAKGGTASKINTRTSFNASPASYTAWHPSGRLAAFSTMQIVQFHHSVGDSRDVFVHVSDLCLYFVDSNSVSSTPAISDPYRLETFPTWSPDGKYLYFSSARRLWPEGLKEEKSLPANYCEARYDLMRISYDVATGTWGELETVLSVENMSINEPRISPDGRFLLFCMSEYGTFPVYQRSSDLHMMDLKSKRHWRLEINSDRSDSWHCWSSNGRWIAFASKRRDGLFGRAYFSYVDPDGKARKPVLLPQRDPAFYDSYLDNFNVPELITGPIGVEQKEFLRAIQSSRQQDATFTGTLPASTPVGEDIQEPTPREPRAATEVDPEEAVRYYRLGQIAEEEGWIEKAVGYYRQSLEGLPGLHPANIPAASRLAWIYATHPSGRVRDGHQAVSAAVTAYKNAVLLAEHGRGEAFRKRAEGVLPSLLDVLAAAYAESGDFPGAVQTALKAETLALRHGELNLAVEIRGRLELYLLDKPYRTSGSD